MTVVPLTHVWARRADYFTVEELADEELLREFFADCAAAHGGEVPWSVFVVVMARRQRQLDITSRLTGDLVRAVGATIERPKVGWR